MTQLNRLILEFNRQADGVRLDGYILQGSVVKRYLERRARKTSVAYGPYYMWTRKIDNKTVTQTLNADQARIIQDALDRNRRMGKQLVRLRRLSEQIIKAITP